MTTGPEAIDRLADLESKPFKIKCRHRVSKLGEAVTVFYKIIVACERSKISFDFFFQIFDVSLSVFFFFFVHSVADVHYSELALPRT